MYTADNGESSPLNAPVFQKRVTMYVTRAIAHAQLIGSFFSMIKSHT